MHCNWIFASCLNLNLVDDGLWRETDSAENADKPGVFEVSTSRTWHAIVILLPGLSTMPQSVCGGANRQSRFVGVPQTSALWKGPGSASAHVRPVRSCRMLYRTGEEIAKSIIAGAPYGN